MMKTVFTSRDERCAEMILKKTILYLGEICDIIQQDSKTSSFTRFSEMCRRPEDYFVLYQGSRLMDNLGKFDILHACIGPYLLIQM